MFGLFTAALCIFGVCRADPRERLAAVHKLLPPVVIPVIMVIGLSVARAASSMAMGQADGKQVIDVTDSLILSGFTLCRYRHRIGFRQQDDEADSHLDRCRFGLCFGTADGTGGHGKHCTRALVRRSPF